DKSEVYLGDENALSLIFNARNEGEGGAYEAELYVVLPPEADYSGIARNNGSLTQLTCSYEADNQTRHLACDLGNPMKSGTSLWAGLRFTVPRLTDANNVVQFQLQIRSKNFNNSESNEVLLEVQVAAKAEVILQGVSRPDKVIFPPPNWTARHSLGVEQDVGPELQQVYELVNNGPSVVSQTMLEVRCPLRAHGHALLYPVEVITVGPINCSSKTTFNALKLKLQAPERESPTSLKSSAEHNIQRREVIRDPLAEQGNLFEDGSGLKKSEGGNQSDTRRYAPPLRRSVRHAGNDNESMVSAGFIALMTSASMSSTATNAELRMLNTAAQSAQMDDPTLHSVNFILLLSSAYPGPGHGGSRLSRDAQTPPPAPSGGAQGVPRPAERHRPSSVSWAVPWASSRWDVPGTPPEEGVQEASGIDARATSTGSSRCGGAAALLRAPPGWPSSTPYL
ncbi:hypothetical protein CHARACLAT_024158, partial [Characodon lateralis]|nr:hypothetical protein [Characodon lateralis]